jgi:hypothetical protein
LLVTEPLLLLLPKQPRVREPVAVGSLTEAVGSAGVAGTQFAAALEQACRAAGFAPRIGAPAAISPSVGLTREVYRV